MATSEPSQHLQNSCNAHLQGILSGVMCARGFPEQARPIDIELHRTGQG